MAFIEVQTQKESLNNLISTINKNCKGRQIAYWIMKPKGGGEYKDSNGFEVEVVFDEEIR